MKTVVYFLIASIGVGVCTLAGAEDRDAQKLAQAPQAVGAARDVTCLTPGIDSLTAQSDFSVFLLPDCPAEVRTDALRKLWLLLPQTTDTEQSF